MEPNSIKFRMLSCLYLALVCLILSSQLDTIITEDVPHPKLVCYVETWASSRPSPMNYNLHRLPTDTCDDLVVLFLTLDPDTWKLRMHNGYNQVTSDQLQSATESKKLNPHMKVLLSVGGWEDGVLKYSNMMATEERRTIFINSVVETLERFAFDGLELHWLFPGAYYRGSKPEDKENFVFLVEELAVVFEPRNWTLAANVPADRKTLNRGYDVEKLNSLLHQMHVHTYDLRGLWTHAAENHSPLYRKSDDHGVLTNLNVNDSLALWVSKGASPRKLVPTFPLFGRSFTLRGPDSNPGATILREGNQGYFTAAPGILAYFEICESILDNVLQRRYDNRTETPFAVGGQQWLGYDDEESLEKKAEFIHRRGYGGAALFAISMDDFGGACGEKHHLLKEMKRYLNSDL